MFSDKPTLPTCRAEPITAAASVAIPAIEDVPRLLSESRAHADQRKRLANRQTAGQHTPNYEQAVLEAQSALSKRLLAHDLDPDHLSPAWASDLAPHDEIVAFLRAYPGIP